MKKGKIIGIVLVLIILIIILFLIYFNYFQVSSKIKLDKDIKEFIFNKSQNTVFFKLHRDSFDNVSKILFVFKDKAGKNYYYSTNKTEKEININLDEIEGFEEMDHIEFISLFFEEFYEELDEDNQYFSDEELLLQEEEFPLTTLGGGSSGGSDGNINSFSQPCVSKNCLELGRECGNFYNHCDELLNCGNCAEGYNCNEGVCLKEDICIGRGCLKNDTCIDGECENNNT